MNWEEVIKNAEYSNKKATATKDKATASFNRAMAKKVRMQKIHKMLIKHIDEIIEPPKKKEQYMIITQMAFNTYTFILYILEKKGIIENLTIATYNMNEKTMLSIMDLLDQQKIKKLSIIISLSITYRMPKRTEQLKKENAKRGNMRLALVWNHSKIALIQTAKDYYVIEGSGNYSDNSRIEQYRFENCKESYEFHKYWIEEYVFKRKKLKPNLEFR